MKESTWKKVQWFPSLIDWYGHQHRDRTEFRSSCLRVWMGSDGRLCVKYRGPLWSRLPEQRFQFMYEVAHLVGYTDAQYVRGVIRSIKR